MRKLSDHEVQQIFCATISHAGKTDASEPYHLLFDAGRWSDTFAGARKGLDLILTNQLTTLVQLSSKNSRLRIRMARWFADALLRAPTEGGHATATIALLIALDLTLASGDANQFLRIARSSAAVRTDNLWDVRRRVLPDEALLLRSAVSMGALQFENAKVLAQEAAHRIGTRVVTLELNFLSSVARRLACHASDALMAVIRRRQM